MIVGVLPARYASTRLPGKPLVDICGLPMIVRTYNSAKNSCFLERVIVATDDERVYKVCKEHDVDVMMTPTDIQTGSDRIAWVAENIFDAEIVVNVQGDEPFISGRMIDQAIEPMVVDPSVQVSTLAKRIENIEQLASPAVVKVVFDMNNDALYFSRSIIPFVRDAENISDAFGQHVFYKHVGLYVYKTPALQRFTTLPISELERVEKLEQLRMLEHGMRIKVVETEFESISVDTPEDLQAAINFYNTTLRES
ncbi:MAG: 3-deoxy-manno-octulosonate cytidylyltransferase [Ignavibacteria bacterium]|nr:3-deoxy-manno-octulosonate cytidylyltransferase [Ignavibacteria bacterium]